VGARGNAGPRRTTAIWLIVATLLLFAGLAAFMHLGVSPDDREKFDMYSSVSPAPDGAKALYALLGELGFRTRRSLGGFEEIDWEQTDVLFMVQPFKAVSSEEYEAIVSWIEEGGTVLLAGQLIRGGPTTSPSLDPDDPFAPHRPTPKQEWRRESSDLKARLLRGVEKFEYRHVFTDRLTEMDVRADEPAWRKGPHEVLVGEEIGFIEITTRGSGRVVKVLDENVLLNQSIRLGSNLVFVLNVLEEWGGRGRVVFDEGHRSIMPQDQPSVWEVLGPASKLAFLQLLVAVVAGIVALGWRPAPALPERRARRRRALEQVEALAGMMERAGAVRLAVRLLHRRTLSQWAAGRFTQGPGPGSIDAALGKERLLKKMDALAEEVESSRRGGRRDLTRYIALLKLLSRGEVKR
jgi:hypothetical protein